MPEYEETQQLFDQTLATEAKKFEQSYLNQWDQSIKDISKIDNKLDKLFKIQEQRNVSAKTKAQFTQSITHQKEEMQQNAEKDFSKKINDFTGNSEIKYIDNTVKSIPYGHSLT
ncbi:MAG: hypothetical protein GY821_04625 [Gammaproteobacteria bacterium]|nr:hypothetical protein [Gammaproteobacteria bacterium]